ncbi:MAG: DUF378 domain-containing protein [Candidatus Aenigmarchaeota archaeon]|nr:DUF378 domain-containing protein [Candidatus Aenigmarchaeota archaeon]
MAKKGSIDMVAKALVIIGGLNWGLVGLLNVDLVRLIFGSIPLLQLIVYVVIGLAALYELYAMTKK